VVAELLGSGTYEIKPQQQVLFREGRLDSVETPAVACGCPAAPVPALQASVDPSKVVSEDEAGEKLQLQNSNTSNSTKAEPGDTPDSNPAAGKDSVARETESPLVFSGEEIAKAKQQNAQKSQQTKAPAAPTMEAANLPSAAKKPDPLPAVVAVPPSNPKPKKGFFGKIRGFFGSIFR
jgi:hypothetical protein